MPHTEPGYDPKSRQGTGAHGIGSSKNQEGQAIVEMTVCMIAIMAVFLGIIFAFAIGSTNIENLLSCRTTADDYAYSGVHSDSGRQIRTWTEGNDERMFTNDDEPQYGGIDAADGFRQELRNDSVDLVSGLGSGYVVNNFAAELAGVEAIFLRSARMTSHSISTDPYEHMNLEDLRGAFRALIFNSDLTITNQVYMPMLNVEDASGSVEP